MQDLTHLLNQHYVNLQRMDIQDAVKFLYQHFMGPGHLIPNEQTAFKQLKAEWDDVQADDSVPLSHPLGNGLFRLNLSKCKALRLSPYTVVKLCFLTASRFTPDPDGLERSLDLIQTLPFPHEKIQDFLAHYRAQNCPMVHHSEVFRRHYNPSYRIASEYYVNIIPILCAIDRARASQPRLRVAIDGPCAGGKSTLGAVLNNIYDCALFHMDDFFLQPEQRTPQRLAEPGGNVDYERFSREILSPLLADQPIRYRPWLCHSGAFGQEITEAPSPLSVVEGCYCLRPDLRDAFQLRIWVDAPWPVRRKRLLKRGGADCLARFEQQWIPMEERYFEHFAVPACCHVHFTSTDTSII